jgi:FAD/FMN-containing dehydrogenase
MSEPSFSEDQMRTLAAVLDEIIPPRSDGALPGAGTLGVGTSIEHALQHTPDIRAVVVAGLSALDSLATARHARGFATLAHAERLAVLNELASTDLGFLLTLTLHGSVGYYQNGRVLEALGHAPRPPHPDGYEVPPNDLTLLEPVRRRPKMYREC